MPNIYKLNKKKESFTFVLKKALHALKNKGVGYVLATTRNRIYRAAFSPLVKLRKQDSFMFGDRKLEYCYTKKGAAWTNERVIEIPIIKLLLKQYKNKRILEIGNVMCNFDKIKSIVVDKYEKAKGVINHDIIDYKPKEKFDVVFSISTLEHVGWDDIPRKQENFLKGIKNIKQNCLKKNAELIFTMPIGYNTYLDNLLKNNKIKINKQYYFKRLSLNNKWIETGKKQALKQKYGLPYECANALLVGVIKN